MIVSVRLTTSTGVNQRSGVRTRRYTDTEIVVLTRRLKHLLAWVRLTDAPEVDRGRDGPRGAVGVENLEGDKIRIA
jgi:hypothetical protein